MQYKLSEIMDIIGGGTPKTSKAEYWNGNIPWIRVKDFNGKRRYVYSTEKCITEQGLKNSSTKLLKKDDIIISARGTVGEIAIIPYPMAFNQSCYGLRANNLVTPLFLYYLLMQNINILKHNTHGTVFDTITKDTFDNIIVDLPPKEKQQKIASILSVLDDKIELNNAINENLEQQAQAIFKYWFVDFEPFGGVMPADWKEYKLSEFLPVITGKKNANISSNSGQYPFFSCSQGITWTDNYSFAGNAILVAGNGDFNVKFYSGKFEAYQRTYVLIPYNPIFTAWLYYLIKYSLDKITILARGSVINFITKGNLENFCFYAPIDLKNCKLLEKFTVINNMIEQNRNENQRLASIRDTLLHKLMKGEIDVSKVKI